MGVRKRTKKTTRSSNARRFSGSESSYLGGRTHRGFFIIIGLLVILLITIIIIHSNRVAYFEEQYELLAQENAKRTAERDAFKEAYQIALEDAQAFGELYESGYRPPIDDAEQQAQGPRQDAFQLTSTDVWRFYHERGLINDSCILATKVVQTPDDLVDFVIIATGDAKIRMLVDAQEVTQFTVTGEESVTNVAVSLPKGTHYLDLVVLNGTVDITTLRIGDRTIETGISLLDYGTGFGVFDCQDTSQGGTLDQPGALRVRLEKL